MQDALIDNALALKAMRVQREAGQEHSQAISELAVALQSTLESQQEAIQQLAEQHSQVMAAMLELLGRSPVSPQVSVAAAEVPQVNVKAPSVSVKTVEKPLPAEVQVKHSDGTTSTIVFHG